jgi:hypothetical protein
VHMCQALTAFERLPTRDSILDPSQSLKFRSTIRLRGWSATTLADYDQNAYMVKFEGSGKRPAEQGRALRRHRRGFADRCPNDHTITGSRGRGGMFRRGSFRS